MGLENTLCFQLSLGSLAATRRVSAADVCTDEVTSNPEAVGSLKVSKRIMQAQEYSDIVTHAQSMSLWLRRRSIPSLLAKGIYLISVGQVEKVEAWVKEQFLERDRLVSRLCERIADIAQEESAAQGVIGNVADYPDQTTIRKALWGRYRYLTFDTPDSLEGINQEIWNQERDKAKALYQEVQENAVALLRAELLELVEHMVKLTEPKLDGGKRRIFSSTLDKFTAFLSELPDRNAIASDPRVAELAAEAAQVLQGIDVEALRKSDSLRSTVGVGMAKVREALVPLVSDAPERVFSFDSAD